MCFYVKTPKEFAIQDIICWKVFRTNSCDGNGFSSYHRDFRYIFGKMYSEGMAEPDNRGEVDKGYHSYSSLKKAKDMWSENCTIVRCYIPRDSELYYNEDRQEYVSDCIRITDVFFTGQKGLFNLIKLIKEKFAK